jgi:hypothetical protein
VAVAVAVVTRTPSWRTRLGAPPELPWATATAGAVALAGYIAMAELDRLATGALTDELESGSITALQGFRALWNTEVWDHWQLLGVPLRNAVGGWIFWTAVFDVLFFVGYLHLLARVVPSATSRVARRSRLVVLLAEITESVLLCVAARSMGDGVVGWVERWSLAVTAEIKWAALAVLAVTAFRSDEVRARVSRGVVRAFRALRVQRLSLIVVVALAALSLVPMANLSDQFPDVLRGWFDVKSPNARGHLAWGLFAYLLAAVALFVLGRLRSERAWSSRVGPPGEFPSPPRRPAQYGLWLVGPAAVGVPVAILLLTGHEELIDRRVLSVFVAVPLVLVGVSWWLARRDARRPPGSPRRLWQEPVNAREPQRALDVWVAGDLLAVAMVVLPALAFVRALVAPIFLGTEADEAMLRTRILVLATSLLVAAGAFRAAAAAFGALDRHSTAAGTRSARLVALLRPSVASGPTALLRRPVAIVNGSIATLLLLAFTLFPVPLGEAVGVVGTSVLALTSWAVVLGLLIVHFQHQQPLEVFRLLHLRANPLVTLLVVVPLLAAVWGGVHGLHDVRTVPGDRAELPERPDLSAAFEEWLGRDPARCSVTVEGERVRPMVLVAASGGGIRAATWTAGIMAALGREGGCAADSVFLSSGVSGGSVGLAVSRGRGPLDALEELARPKALPAALAGTLVGDLVAGSSGLRIPSLFGGEWAWRDRAALIETIWERDAAALARPYDTDRGRSGFLLLNSTDAITGCRVLISQVDLRAEDGERDGRPGVPHPLCAGPTEDVPASVDLRTAYGDCTPAMTWATAALLSARFPTVTPAGRLPVDEDCSELPRLQLVDGGYAESSGLGTLADVAPAALQPVLSYNADRDPGDPVVVPLVLYLEDEPRTEIAQDPEGLTPELLVPLEGRDAGAVQTATSTWLQRAAAAWADPCPEDGDRRCAAAVTAVHERLPSGAVVAAPLTSPGVEAPLGWTLSDESRERLRDGVEAQRVDCGRDREEREDGGRYACLEDLLDVLDGP